MQAGARSIMERAFFLKLFFFCLCIQALSGYIQVTPEMKSFSSAIKGGHVSANVEKVLYEHSTGQPGVVTEQWFTGEVFVYAIDSITPLIIFITINTATVINDIYIMFFFFFPIMH